MINNRMFWFLRFVFCLCTLWVYAFSMTDLSVMASPPHLAGRQVQYAMQYSGSPFIIDRWLTGEVQINTGMWQGDVFLRYDALNDRLLWMIPQENNKLIELDKHLIREFKLHDSSDTLRFIPIPSSGLIPIADSRAFVQVLVEDSLSLLVFRRKRVSTQMGPVVDPQGGVRQALRLLDDPVYLLRFPDGSMRSLRRDKRWLLQATRSYFPEVSTWLRGVPTRLRTETELIQAVEIINQNAGL